MANLVVAAVRNSYLCSLGVLVDAHARLAEMFAEDSALASTGRLHTGLQLLTAGARQLPLAGGRTFVMDGALDDVSDPALVYLPNFQLPAADLPGFVAQQGRLQRWLARLAERGVPICASGASVWIAAAAGLLDERRASVDVRQAAAFRRAFPKVHVDLRHASTTGEPVMTCAAEAEEQAFAIHAIHHALSSGAALWLALRRGGAEGSEVSQDPLVARAQMLIRERFTHDLSIEDLAQELSVSHRTLIRRFRASLGQSPRAYIQRQRLQAAAASLRETRRTVAEIAANVGYADAPSFRAAFRAYTGATPSEYRKLHARHARDGAPQPATPPIGDFACAIAGSDCQRAPTDACPGRKS
jgi:transcriptional regulator GlxA family with amidase domain